MKIFLDTEFTGLHQKTSLLSIGIISDDHRTFYAELTDYHQEEINDWLRANVLAHFRFGETNCEGTDWYVHGDSAIVGTQLRQWFSVYDKGEVQVWADVLAYDWVLFCELFGGAMQLPEQVYYLPFDVATLLLAKGIDPDIHRETFVQLPDAQKHNALWDARVTKAVYEKIA
jgi:3' exoribonuclease, RNase T-like